MPSSQVVCRVNGGAFSPTGTFTVTVKSSPARSAMRSRMRREHAGPTLQRSAELVVAPVPERRQELVDQLGVARRELEPVVAGLARPRRRLAVLHGHGADVVAGHHVDRRAPVDRAERERWLRRRQQRLLALRGVGLVPRLHGEQPAEAHLDPDRRRRPGGPRRPSAPGGASAPACSRSSCPARCGPRRRGRSCPG